jgi:preprotein translocase subunit YajC
VPTPLALTLMAQADPGASPFGGPNSMLFLILIFFGIFYFMIIRPQQQQQKKLQAYLDSLKKGDEVVTTGGLIGKIDKVAGAVLFIDFGNNNKIRVLKAQIVGPFVPVEEKPEAKPDSKDSKADPASTEKK